MILRYMDHSNIRSCFRDRNASRMDFRQRLSLFHQASGRTGYVPRSYPESLLCLSFRLKDIFQMPLSFL